MTTTATATATTATATTTTATTATATPRLLREYPIGRGDEEAVHEQRAERLAAAGALEELWVERLEHVHEPAPQFVAVVALVLVLVDDEPRAVEGLVAE